MSANMTWTETINEVLDSHEVREPLAEVLLWRAPGKSATWFGAGVALFVIVEVFGIGIMTVLGAVCILQLLVYRISSFLQDKGMAFEDVDLREKLILTPEPANVAKTVEILGDVMRITEENITEMSFTNNYLRLAEGCSTLLFLSALGRVVSLPILLLTTWVIAFVGPLLYVKNQRRIDKLIDRSAQATEKFLDNGAAYTSKRKSSRAKSIDGR